MYITELIALGALAGWLIKLILRDRIPVRMRWAILLGIAVGILAYVGARLFGLSLDLPTGLVQTVFTLAIIALVSYQVYRWRRAFIEDGNVALRGVGPAE